MKTKILFVDGDDLAKEVNVITDHFIFICSGKNYYSLDTATGKMYLNNPLSGAHKKLVKKAMK